MNNEVYTTDTNKNVLPVESNRDTSKNISDSRNVKYITAAICVCVGIIVPALFDRDVELTFGELSYKNYRSKNRDETLPAA